MAPPPTVNEKAGDTSQAAMDFVGPILQGLAEVSFDLIAALGEALAVLP